MKNIFLILALLVILVGGYFFLRPVAKNLPSPSSSIFSVPSSSPELSKITMIAENLDTPWAIAFLPDNAMLVTERAGSVRLIDSSGQLQVEPLAVLGQVKEIGEGGLLGIAIHPDFLNNHYIYLYYTYSENNGNTLNRVVKMTYQNNTLTDEQIIVDKIPGASNHNGGRIAFGPDKALYVTTGDAGEPSRAQDTSNLAGKILRVTDDQKVEVYSFGHRNPQGITWDDDGNLWEVEHGQSATDELNLIEKGLNYGWPIIRGNQTKKSMETPKLNSGSTTWAPAGAAYINNSIFFAGLRGQALYEAVLNGSQITLKEHFKEQFGRIREVILGPDNMLYITTSNQDGRGIPSSSDDRVIKINPQQL